MGFRVLGLRRLGFVGCCVALSKGLGGLGLMVGVFRELGLYLEVHVQLQVESKVS